MPISFILKRFDYCQKTAMNTGYIFFNSWLQIYASEKMCYDIGNTQMLMKTLTEREIKCSGNQAQWNYVKLKMILRTNLFKHKNVFNILSIQ